MTQSQTHSSANISQRATVNDVVNCYRLLLGREPDTGGLSAHSSLVHRGLPVEDLVQLFLESPEFQQRHAFRANAIPIAAPLDTPKNQIDVEADSASIAELVAHIKHNWEFLGQQRAHHSVLTNADYLPDAFLNNEAAFWSSGEGDANMVEAILARHGTCSVANLDCIDFGCGVGRVTAPLAKRFRKVIAYDISTPHLAIAKSRTANAAFHILRELPIELEAADVFYSRIVFQHNPPPIIALLIQSALKCLRPQGIAIFQVPTYERGYSFSLQKYLNNARAAAPDMEMHCLPQRYIFKLAADAGCNVLEVREDNSTGRYGSDVSNVFVIQR